MTIRDRAPRRVGTDPDLQPRSSHASRGRSADLTGQTSDCSLGESPRATLRLRLIDMWIEIEGPTPMLSSLSKCFRSPIWATETDARRESDLWVSVSDSTRLGDVTLEVRTRPPASLPSMGRLFQLSPLLLATCLTRWAVAEAKHHYVFHAGALSRTGLGLIMPGCSGAGKSTLTAGLLRRGFLLLSDELGLVDIATRQLAGYQRYLSVRRDVLATLGLPAEAGDAAGDLENVLIHPSDLGGDWAESEVAPVLVVAPQFLRGADTDLVRLCPTDAFTTLMAASCSLPRHKSDGLDFVLAAARELPVYRLQFSDLEAALDAVEGAFDSVARTTLAAGVL